MRACPYSSPTDANIFKRENLLWDFQLLLSVPFILFFFSFSGENEQTVGGLWKARRGGRYSQSSQWAHQRRTHQEDVCKKWNSTRSISLLGESAVKLEKCVEMYALLIYACPFSCFSSTIWCCTAFLSSGWWGRSLASERGSTLLAWRYDSSSSQPLVFIYLFSNCLSSWS